MRFSAPVKKHWLGSFSVVLPPSGLRGFVPVVRDCWEQGPPIKKPGAGDRVGGADTMGAWGPGTRQQPPAPPLFSAVVGCFPPASVWFPPFPPCGVVWVGWFPPACLDLLEVFGKPMLMMILMMMMMMTIIMIIIITIILVFLWLVVGYLLPTCLLTIIALLTVGARSL